MDSAGSDQLHAGLGGDTPAAVLADLAAVIDRAQALSGGDLWDHETRSLVAELEVAARRIDATRVTMLSHINRSGLHHVDGHASPKVMVRHLCRLSSSEAARRERQERALRHLPLVAEAYWAGSVGTEQVDLVARVYSNPRVREALVEFQPDLLVLAAECEYPVFEQVLRQWERLVDADGPEPKADEAHRNRHLTMFQDPESLAWKTRASLDSMKGSRVHDVLRRLADQERLLGLVALWRTGGVCRLCRFEGGVVVDVFVFGWG